jgi:hypothetical protein
MAIGSNNGNNGSSGNGALPPIHFENLATDDMSDSSNRRYHKPPSEYEDQTWHLGWTDGRCGQPAGDNESILRARARLAWQHKISASEAEIGATSAVVNIAQSILGRLRNRLDSAVAEHHKLTSERNDNPQSYSLSLWVIYSLAAVCLLAADLPLSLKLVAMGYGVTTENPMDARSIDDLFIHPWYVITHFWEALLLAAGIALAGIFVKYFLDAVVYREEQKTLSWVFAATLSGLLVLFIATTFLLGMFRADVQRQKNITDLTNKLSYLEEQRGAKPDPQIDKAITNINTLITGEQGGSRLSVRTISFIALTLLFPIIGGVCFSVGWRKLVKVRRLRRAGKEMAMAEIAFDAGLARYEQARGALESQIKGLERDLTTYATADDYAEMLVNLYRHGYSRGRNVPETIDAGASLYDRCEKAVARLLSGKMRERYWDAPPPSLS